VLGGLPPSTGACVPDHSTVKVHWLPLPLLSRAVLVTVVVPTGKAKPLAARSLRWSPRSCPSPSH